MIALYATLLIPLVATFIFGVIGHWKHAGTLNVIVCAATLATSLQLALDIFNHGAMISPGQMFYIDPFNVYLILVNALVGLTTSIFSRPYMAHELKIGRVDDGRMRLYHSMFQGFLLTMLVALSTNNLGILWVSVEGATLATVLLVSLYRTPESIEAGWKYFILCGVGIAQALFGTVLVYFAAEKVLPGEEGSLLWSVLQNIALYAVVRYKMLIEPALDNHIPSYMMMGFGMLSFTVAGILLHRQRDIKRMFSYSSIEHMGLMTFAFGLGGPLATFGALLHMIVHSLTKSAIFITVGHAAHIAGTQAISEIRGLIRTQPAVGWTFLLGTVAIAGFPPFGVFTSEFLLFSATIKSAPWLVAPLLIGLAVAFAGLFRHVQPMVFGEPPEGQLPVKANMLPIVFHLVLVLWLGLSIPQVLANWLDQATIMVVGKGLL